MATKCCGSEEGGSMTAGIPGRVCASDYRIPAAAFSGEPGVACDVLYAVGGLYGNQGALRAAEELASRETGKVLIVLNGDMHWFDKSAEEFARLEEMARPYLPLAGNVEAELRRAGFGEVGCGCSYPLTVSDAFVERSNQIFGEMRAALEPRPELKELLINRPATLTVSVAGAKVALTHGDEKFIAGWGCSRESLRDESRQDELSRWFRANGVEVLAVTHTCAAAAIVLPDGIVINNGAAGMPCFRGQEFGLITRIAATDHGEALYRGRRGQLSVEALPLRYGREAFLSWFDALWAKGSAAEVSYRARIADGPEDLMADALLGGFEEQ